MIIFKTLKKFLYENRREYITGIAFLIFIDILQLLIPMIYKSFADAYQQTTLDGDGIILYALLIIASGLSIGTGRFMWRIKIHSVARKAEYHLRDRIFSKLLTLTPTFYNENSAGDLMALATNDVNAIRMTVGMGIVLLVDSSLMIVLSIGMMLKTLGLSLTLLSLSLMPIIVIFVAWYGKRIHIKFRQVQDSFGEVSDDAREIFSGIRIVKANAADELFIDKFQRASKKNFDANISMVKYQAFFRPFIMFVSASCFFIILLFGGRAVINRTISLGDFSSAIMYLNLLVWPLMAFGMIISQYQRGSASMERINELLDVVPDIIDPQPNAEKMTIEKIEFKNVSFKYAGSENLALEDISFTLERGKTLAIIGSTGSGKSTIINLLLRLYDLEEGQGEILINGIPIRECSIKATRDDIGAVLQESFLFSMTIGDNIAFSEEGQYDHDDVVAAAKTAAVHSNIIDFPDQYDTVLGERGVTLSGGQRQRTAIARALFRNPEVLIFDSSFSAVDTETEDEILNNLQDDFDKKAIILVSHRISTVKDADEILVMDDGKIIERGNNDELIALNGLYKELNDKQKLEKIIEEMEA